VVFEMQNLLARYIEFRNAFVHDKDLCDMFKHSGKEKNLMIGGQIDYVRVALGLGTCVQ
jgi:hypothetical protein